MRLKCCRFPAEQSVAEAIIENRIIKVGAKLCLGQTAPASWAQLRPTVQVKHLALLIVMVGIAAMNPQVLANTSLTPNSSQFEERPDPPDRGIPAERKHVGMQQACAKSEAPFTRPVSTYTASLNSSQLIERLIPPLPPRGIPTERKPAGMHDPCTETEVSFTPIRPIIDTGLSGKTLLQLLCHVETRLVRSISQQPTCWA